MLTKKRTLWILAGLVVLPLLLWGALTLVAPKRPEAPPRGAGLSAPPTPELSTLLATVSLPFSELEPLFNEKLPQPLLEEKGKEAREGFLVDVKASKKGKLKLQGERGALIVLVPVSVSARLYRAKRAERKERRGKEAPDGGQISADFTLRIELQLGISSDAEWRLESRSSVSYKWLSTPTIQAGILKIGIDELMDKILKEKLPEIAKKLNASLESKDLLRPKLGRLWPSLSSPQRLREDPPVWLISSLEALYASDFKTNEYALELVVGASGRFQLLLGEATATPPAPLLPRSEPPASAGFQLALSTELSWSALSTLATAKVTGQSWPLPQSAGTLTAGKLELYPSGEQLVVALSYRADIPGWPTDGTLYFLGKPALDEAARTLQLKEFSYLLQTQDEAVAGLNALLESSVTEAIQQRLSFSFGEKLDAAQEQANQRLKERKIEGGLEAMALRGVRLTEEAVVIDASASGALMLRPSGVLAPK